MAKQHRLLGLKIVDAVIGLITILVGVALLFSYFAPLVNPNRILWFAFLGLVAPFLYVGNVLLMLYWILRWRRIAFVPIVLTLIGLLHVGKYFRPQFQREYETAPRADGTLRVLSYNVSGFWGKNAGTDVSRMVQIAEYIAEENPDILCMQEYEVNHVNTRAYFDSVMEPLRYKAINYTIQGKESGWGLAIYSRYRIIDKGSIVFPESTNSAMWADIVVKRDTIRVFNCHLQTTQVNEEDKSFLRDQALTDTLRQDKALGIARKLARNFRKRAVQADSLALHIHDGTPRVIVCGDFNDTPMSYTYGKMRGDMKDAFQQKGRGAIYTYRGLMGVFRIDYLFHTKEFETVDYQTEQPAWSDHNPVVVDLKLKH